MKILKILGIVIVIAAAVMITVRFITPEDTWLCRNGAWIKHGSPDGLPPISPCGDNHPLEIVPGWLNFIDDNNGIIFQYPDKLDAQYISLADWPPTINVDSRQTQLDCVETDPASSLADRVSKRSINGRDYCLKAMSEGAAGSVYTNYDYSSVVENKLVSLNFSLQFPQCYNYDEPKQSQCQTEREQFDLDEIVGRMFETIDFTTNAVAWENVKQAIENCQVKSSMQAHSLRVSVELKDGSVLTAIEPQIDEIFRVINSVSGKCGSFPMATE